MNLELYLGFILAAAVLVAIPGPVVTLLVATAIRDGKGAALSTVAGSSTALVFHMLAVGLGLTSLLAFIGEWFEWLKWVGALYLVWLGISAWKHSYRTEALPALGPKNRNHFVRGFLVGVTNPKTLLFYAAFFPQFIDPSLPLTQQLLWLCPTFLVVGGTIDTIYALSASRAGKLFTSPLAQMLSDRVSGTLLILAGAGLAATRRI